MNKEKDGGECIALIPSSRPHSIIKNEIYEILAYEKHVNFNSELRKSNRNRRFHLEKTVKKHSKIPKLTEKEAKNMYQFQKNW